MASHYTALATQLYQRFAEQALQKRFLADPEQRLELPSWTWIVVLVHAIIFLPVLVWHGYTLSTLLPVLAAVEDPNPPAYEPVSLNADSDSIPDARADTEAGAAKPLDSKPVTSSLRGINRLLLSVGGWRSHFRGLACAAVYGICVTFITGLFSALPLGSLFGSLLASVALCQLSTVWVHVVISVPSDLRFTQRHPPLRRTAAATALPILVCWAATTLERVLPLVLSYLMGLPLWHTPFNHDVPQHGVPQPPAYTGSDVPKALLIAVVTLLVSAFVVIPARVVLWRVQASLLPGDVDTIIPVDRSFKGTVEPAIVGGKGYVSAMDAFKTFGRESWIRLYKLYAKILAVSFAIALAIMIVLIPEIFFIVKNSKTTQV